MCENNMVEQKKADHHFKQSGMPINVVWRDPQPDYPLHCHEYSELILVYRGSAVHIVDNLRFPISAGDMFVISGKREHRFVECDDFALANVIFSPELLKMHEWDISDLPGFRAMFLLEPEYRERHQFKSRLELSGNEMRKTLSVIRRLSDEIERKDPGFRLDAKAIFMRLLVFLARCYEHSAQANPHTMSLLRIARAIDYLDKHYLEEVDYKELGRIASMSQRHFQRIFRYALNCTARQYVIRLRIRKAMQLLRGSSFSISEVAFECGFDDSNYFSRMFRKYSGTTPNKYREVYSGFADDVKH